MAAHAKKPTHGNTIIWRYTALDKFLDLLLNRRLYFCATDELTDKYEAFLPPGYFEQLRAGWRTEEIDEKAVDNRELEFIRRVIDLRSRIVVNAWSATPHESYALWKIYLGGAQAGVAIRTTVARLKRALKPDPNAFDGPLDVRTVDYSEPASTKEPPWEDLVTLKAPFYAYEQEVRCLGLISRKSDSPGATIQTSGTTWLLPPPPSRPKKRTGLYVDVDLDELIQELYISPFVGKWAHEVLQRLLRTHANNLVDRVIASGVKDQ
jgi:hypothetical protein